MHRPKWNYLAPLIACRVTQISSPITCARIQLLIAKKNLEFHRSAIVFTCYVACNMLFLNTDISQHVWTPLRCALLSVSIHLVERSFPNLKKVKIKQNTCRGKGPIKDWFARIELTEWPFSPKRMLRSCQMLFENAFSVAGSYIFLRNVCKRG